MALFLFSLFSIRDSYADVKAAPVVPIPFMCAPRSLSQTTISRYLVIIVIDNGLCLAVASLWGTKQAPVL